jgi:hypothetical protein
VTPWAGRRREIRYDGVIVASRALNGASVMGYNRSGQVRKQRLKRRKRHLQRLMEKEASQAGAQTQQQPQGEKK